MFFYFAFLFLTFLSALFVNWYMKKSEKLAVLKKIPSEIPTFLLGNVNWTFKIISRKSKYHSGVYLWERVLGYLHLRTKLGFQSFWVGPHNAYIGIDNPELVELIVSSSSIIDKSAEYSFLHKWLGLGLLTSSRSKWRSRRKLLTPCFHFRILDDFVPTFNEQSLVLVNKIESMLDKEYVDLLPTILLCTLDIVCETMMGVRIGAQEGNNSEYVAAIHNTGSHYIERFVRPWLWPDFIFYSTSAGKKVKRDIATLHNLTNKVIKDKKAEILKRRSHPNKDKIMEEFGEKKRRAFLDLLLDLHMDGEQISEEDIREEVDTFMFEGHDTTGLAITYALYCIGLYPEVQKNVVNESDAIFNGDMERPVTLDDVRDMKYLECVIKESMRLYPSVPIIGRKLDEEVHFRGYTIPKGVTVYITIMSLHKRADIYPEPEVFNPDRFLPENSLNRHPYAFIPFSAGPRNCIGQKFALLEEKIVLTNVLRHYRIVSLDPRDRIQVKFELTLTPDIPIRVKFIPR